jgi:hypothetical protein
MRAVIKSFNSYAVAGNVEDHVPSELRNFVLEIIFFLDRRVNQDRRSLFSAVVP